MDAPTRHFLQARTRPGELVLEIGCGPGQYRYAVNGDYIGTDITGKPYNDELPRTPDAVAGAASLPFRGAAFDLVFFSNLFHYFGAPLEILGEAMRVLKPGGWLLIFDYSKPTLERLRERYRETSPGFTAHPHACRDWLALMTEAGLAEADLVTKGVSPAHRLLRLLHNPLTRALYHAVIDSREAAICVAGRKPRAGG